MSNSHPISARKHRDATRKLAEVTNDNARAINAQADVLRRLAPEPDRLSKAVALLEALRSRGLWGRIKLILTGK